MKFSQTNIHGTYIIDLEKKEDDRGFLSRVWGQEEFKVNGIDFSITQGYTTYSKSKGTLRGFHFLSVPEQKLTRVTRGSIFEVIIDIRSESKTFRKWQSFTFSSVEFKMLYMGPGIAHAILTTSDNTEMVSLYSPDYNPAYERGIRYNDPAFSIPWAIPVTNVSEKDLTWEDFK